jgi:hypothetical protein
MALKGEGKVVDIDKGVSFGMASQSIIEITKKETEPDAFSSRQSSSIQWAIWGKNNNYPQEVIDANMQDTTSAGALDFKIKAHYGKGLYFYHESINDKGEWVNRPLRIMDLPQEMQDFYYRNDLVNFQQGIIQDYEWWNFFYVQYIINKSVNRILGVKWQRTKDVRSAKRDLETRRVPLYYLSAYWPKPQSDQYSSAPAFDLANPLDPNVPNGIYKHQLVSIDKDYYPTAKWQSNHRWLATSRKISQWINAAIDNSVNLKYHIEIPEQYFFDLYPERDFPEGREACLKARAQAEKQLKEDIDKCLTGADNPQKIFYTKFAIDKETGDTLPGWKINELKNDLKDNAWLSADATAASRITSAHAVDPTLSGLRTGNSLNVGSGSDMREKFNYYLQLHTTIGRQTTTEWYDIVQRVNHRAAPDQWPLDIKIGYRDVILDTLNNAKSGFQVQGEKSPTSAAA